MTEEVLHEIDFLDFLTLLVVRVVYWYWQDRHPDGCYAGEKPVLDDWIFVALSKALTGMPQTSPGARWRTHALQASSAPRYVGRFGPRKGAPGVASQNLPSAPIATRGLLKTWSTSGGRVPLGLEYVSCIPPRYKPELLGGLLACFYVA